MRTCSTVPPEARAPLLPEARAPLLPADPIGLVISTHSGIIRAPHFSQGGWGDAAQAAIFSKRVGGWVAGPLLWWVAVWTAVAGKRRVVDARAGFTHKKGLHFARIFGICSEWLASWLGCAASMGGARAHVAQFAPHFSQCNICVVFAHHCITRVYFTFRSGEPPSRPPEDRFAPTST